MPNISTLKFIQYIDHSNEEVSKTIEEITTLMGLACKVHYRKIFNRSKALMYSRDLISKTCPHSKKE